MQTAADEAKPPNPLLVGIVLVAALGSLALMPATFLFLFVTMAPAMVLAWTDRNRDQMRVQAMASMNAAVAIPTLVTLWNKGNTIDVAVGLLLSPATITGVVVSAIGGWFLLFMGPQLAARAITYINKREAKTLRMRNREMLEVWGEDLPEDATRIRSGKSLDGV